MISRQDETLMAPAGKKLTAVANEIEPKTFSKQATIHSPIWMEVNVGILVKVSQRMRLKARRRCYPGTSETRVRSISKVFFILHLFLNQPNNQACGLAVNVTDLWLQHRVFHQQGTLYQILILLETCPAHLKSTSIKMGQAYNGKCNLCQRMQ